MSYAEAPSYSITPKEEEMIVSVDYAHIRYAKLTEINEREIFVYAFWLGMRIAIEVFTEPERQ